MKSSLSDQVHVPCCGTSSSVMSCAGVVPHGVSSSGASGVTSYSQGPSSTSQLQSVSRSSSAHASGTSRLDRITGVSCVEVGVEHGQRLDFGVGPDVAG